MMNRIKNTQTVLAVLTATLGAHLYATGQSKTTLEEVLQRGDRYIAEYGQKMSLIVGTEHYSQWVENPGWRSTLTRTMVSEYAIVRVEDDWMGFRDIHQVDGKTLADRQDRLEKLFLQSPTTAIHDARQIADESARYNMGVIQRNFNTPTMALFFLQAANQSRFVLNKTGEDRVDGRLVWKVRYQETHKPTLIRTSGGKDMPVHGTMWIDPEDGRVFKTEMRIESEARVEPPISETNRRGRGPGGLTQDRIHTSASVTVIYKEDASLGLLVPAEMLETYEGPRITTLPDTTGTTKINCRAVYADFRRFETGSKWSVPK